MNRRSAQAGFSLLEVLAAFVVFTLLFATTLQIMSASLRNVTRSEQYTQAALWAQSRMASVGVEPPIEAGTWDGNFNDDYAWELSIEPYQLVDQLSAQVEEFPVDLYRVELIVTWGRDRPRQARFVTLRSATPQR